MKTVAASKAILVAILTAFPLTGFALSNVFTYQGSLEDANQPANGDYDLQFQLQTGSGVPVGAPVLADNVSVTQGVFTVDLNFGSAITSGDFQLQIGVRPGASVGAFTALVPPTRIAPTPQAQVAGLAAEAVTVSPNSIGSASISNGSIVAADVDTSVIQRRVASSCAANEAIRVINTDGTVSCVVVPAGTIGQSGSSVFGSGPVSINNSSPQTLIPGLSTTITVPAASVVYLSTDGAIRTTSPFATVGFSVIDVFLTVDGSILANGGYQRVVATNTDDRPNTFNRAWSFSQVVTVSAGTHTFEVRAAGIFNVGATATVSGDTTSPNQGTLNVLVLKL